MEAVHLNFNAIAPEEREAAKFMETNLLHMRSACDGFDYAVQLFLHVRELRMGLDVWKKVAWTRIAGRSGAIDAYSFAMAMQAINKAVAPQIWAAVNMDARDTANELFKAEFSTIEGIRHSAAHPGELSGKKSELERHRLKEPMNTGGGSSFAQGAFVSDLLEADDQRLVYNGSFNGRAVSYELSAAKAAALETVGGLYAAAFRPLSW